MRRILSILFLLYGVLTPIPIFSATYNDWRLAGEFVVGEKVLTYHSVEIKDLNNLLVGGYRVVMHNNYISDELIVVLKNISKNIIGL